MTCETCFTSPCDAAIHTAVRNVRRFLRNETVRLLAPMKKPAKPPKEVLLRRRIELAPPAKRYRHRGARDIDSPVYMYGD